MSSHTPTRPEHLPDYLNPPLNEVVLGVQFTPPAGYHQIFAHEIWNQFRDEYPQVQEQAPLQPSFETFGLPSTQQAGELNFITGASHDRFWFLNETGCELLQFQQDRFLHNWRKVADQSSVYPRFENMVSRFENELLRLENYFNSLQPQTIGINQCEISYINHIELYKGGQSLSASSYLNFLNFNKNIPDDLRVNFRQVIRDENSKPQGRITIEAITAYDAQGNEIIRLSLTARGAPKEPTIKSALEFISKGREQIISIFTELTTDLAHKLWERVK